MALQSFSNTITLLLQRQFVDPLYIPMAIVFACALCAGNDSPQEDFLGFFRIGTIIA